MSDVIRKLSDLKKVFDQINLLRKAGRDVQRSFEAAERAARTGLLTGDDEATIMADAIARHFQELFRECARWDETKWVEATSYNAFDPSTYAPAVAAVKNDRQRFLNLREGFTGMAQLLQIKRISDNIDVKKLAKAWVPSLIAINEIHRQDVISRFNGLAATMDTMAAKLDNVLKAIDRPAGSAGASVGQFNFASLSPGAALVTRVPLLRGRVWAYPSFCKLTFDVPAGTPFTVRGVQTVEKWFDVEARNLVGLTLRCSAAEGASLFTTTRA
jgi:hypothetical protein